MADESKVAVLADEVVSELEGKKAGAAFLKGFQSVVGAATLGNGMAPTSMPPSQGAPDVQLLDKILTTLQAGFSRLAGDGPPPSAPGSTAVNAGSGGSGVASTVGYRPGAEDQSRPRRERWVAGVSSVLGAAPGLMGGSDQGAIGMASAVGQVLLPGLAPIISTLAGIMTQRADTRDLFATEGRRRFQAGGWSGYDVDDDKYGGISPNKRTMMGFGISEFSSLYTGAARAGAMSGRDTAGQGSLMLDLMRGENAYGAGGSMSSLAGAATRTGTGDASKAIGTAVAVAVSEKLDRGRYSEVVEQLTQAINSNTIVQADISSTATRMMFISQMGPQFQGNSAAHREMEQSLKNAATSSDFGQIAALSAAGFTGGPDGINYTEAMYKVQRGMDNKGGYSSVDFATQLLKRAGITIAQYRRMSRDEKMMTWQKISLMSRGSLDMPKVELILSSLEKGTAGVDADSGLAQMKADQAPYATNKPRSQRALGENINRDTVDAREGGGGGVIGQAFRSQYAGDPDAGPMTGPDGAKAQGGWAGAAAAASAGAGTPSSSDGSDLFMSHVAKGGAFHAQRPTGPHPGIDSSQTPGTPVYAWRDGHVLYAGLDKKNNPLNYGWYVSMVDTDGKPFSQHHMDPAKAVKLAKGTPVFAGITLLGYVAKMKGPHIHVQAGPKGTVDPQSIGNLDMMLGVDAAKAARAAAHPAASSGGSTPAPTPTGPSDISSEAAGGSSGPTSMAAPRQGVDVAIYVYDGRITATTTAAASRMQRGEPNRSRRA